MSEIIESGTVAFSIEGSFVAKLARERAWYDEDRSKALDVLACVDGLSVDAMTMILDGNATLTGNSKTGVYFVQKEDKAWKAVIEERKAFFTKRAMRKAQELVDQINDLERDRQNDQIRATAVSEFMAREPYTGVAKEVKLKGKVFRVGTYDVSKNLVEQYATVVRRQRRGAFMGVRGEIGNDPLAFFQLEEKRVEIHDKILAECSLTRDGPGETEFSIALHESVNKLVGMRGEK